MSEHEARSGADPTGEATPTHVRHRTSSESGGKKRDLSYPAPPNPLVVPVYDNHTHLEIADGEGEPGTDGGPLDYREHLDRASAVGIRGVVQVGTDVETSRWSAEIAAREPRVLAAVALHPNEAPRLADEGRLDAALAVIDELAARPRVRAIGETGLDFFRTGPEGRAAQIESFAAHIEIAKRHGLALQIHDRDAHDDVVDLLLEVGAPERTVFHCFSGGPELAGILAENGWYASFSGTVTFSNAQPLRDALVQLPRHLLLVETDAPYLTPVPYRGRPNAPYLVPFTLRSMAETIGTDVSMLAAQISSNTELVYGGWDDEPVTVDA
ncbi:MULTISPECIES: TatD family hydrolase [unclassified Frigoribacterium]|uniref:TatD family hydrolase n=1 Tax=unclassified Frigoribacterium TaxID=2627005 RepID=UPI0006FDF1D6|nr:MULTISPECIES: TatD family hydrolase [unclassified Frigoribacterium]KQO84110.1 deoxyribonuclease [Frigoribacterium sp. Leaf263]KQR66441.1 deoxyribonuclease [Frigoribacterium sp. Leaf172]